MIDKIKQHDCDWCRQDGCTPTTGSDCPCPHHSNVDDLTISDQENPWAVPAVTWLCMTAAAAFAVLGGWQVVIVSGVLTTFCFILGLRWTPRSSTEGEFNE